MRPYVRIEGMSQLRRALLMVGEEGHKTVVREVRRAALEVQAGAKQRAPVDTGRLRNSIAVEISAEGTSAQVGSNVEYAGYVEHGTRRNRAQPYLFPAYEEAMPRFFSRLRRELGSAYVKVSRNG